MASALELAGSGVGKGEESENRRKADFSKDLNKKLKVFCLWLQLSNWRGLGVGRLKKRRLP